MPRLYYHPVVEEEEEEEEEENHGACSPSTHTHTNLLEVNLAMATSRHDSTVPVVSIACYA